MKTRKHIQGSYRIGHDAALGDLQGKPLGRQVIPLEQAGDGVRELEVLQGACGEIDGYGNGAPSALPGLALARRRFQHPNGQGLDQTVLFRKGMNWSGAMKP